MIAAGQNIIANRLLQPAGMGDPYIAGRQNTSSLIYDLTPEQRSQLEALRSAGYDLGDAINAVRSGTVDTLLQPKVYSPDVGSAFEDTRRWQQKYEDAISKGIDPLEIPELAEAYTAYDWAAKGEDLMSKYNAPTYESAAYQMPEEYQQFQYYTPEVAEIESVDPLASEIWGAKKSQAMEDVTNQFADIKRKTQEELIRTGRRPEQAAAVLANIEFEEQKARDRAQRALDIEEAQQKVGIAQTEQGLKAQRGEFEAGLNVGTQERQAGEGQFGYGQTWAQTQWKQAVDEANKRFGYETSLEKERYLAAQRQWIAEQEAAEQEKQWQSEYARSQDKAQTEMAKWEANKNAQIDQWNAILQGGTQAGQTAAQEATYATNLTEDERGKARDEAKKQETYTAAMQNQKPTVTKTQPTYAMPTKANQTTNIAKATTNTGVKNA